jgi:hypothetical protein
MQIKTTLIFELTTIGMVIETKQATKNAGEEVGKKKHLYAIWDSVSS